MSKFLEFVTVLHQYLNSPSSSSAVPKSPDALKFGVLSTAMVNFAAIVHPISSHPLVLLYGVASRNASAASSYAKKYGFTKSYASYDSLLSDPEIDAVYIPLPNGMHYTWARKALEAGKHVLLEKPFTSNADEARRLADFATERGRVLLEAFHWRFHPSALTLREWIESGKYGKVKKTCAQMTAPKGTMPKGDIRWNYELAGGALMDMTYVVSSTRFFLSADEPDQVLEATAVESEYDPRVDSSTTATLSFASPYAAADDGKVVSKIYADMAQPLFARIIPRFWESPKFEIETTTHDILFFNYLVPHLYHYIQIKEKSTGKKEVKKIYTGGPWGDRGAKWWTTYRWQLEAFVDKCLGKEPLVWINLEDSVAEMRAIDKIYEATGLGKREGASE